MLVHYPLRKGVATRNAHLKIARKGQQGGYSGTQSRPYLWKTRTPAMFACETGAANAIRRAKRWLRNQSRGPLDIPPRHIFRRAELAAFQFGDSVKNA